ncbi:MAG: MetQ/NlpA family ABC transporter substrate-binding protein [Synergistaceae bacterium]|jgi:D-methionine transport system substrate-binding protein|nr:MetQ/NlpA family ABC transporter substrate-binding protein [Synergistaceae bacterium]
MKEKMKFTGRLLGVTLAVALAASVFAGWAEAADRTKLKVGIVGESYEAIWAPVIRKLASEGIDIELINFADYMTPNAALDAGELDLNAFQHHTFLNNEIANKGYKITPIADTFLSAMCLYSKKIKSVKELKEGDKIAFPNEVINQGRSLTVLQGAGLIKLRPGSGLTPDVTDIVENPLKLEFVTVDAAQVASVLDDVAAGVINGNYAIDFGLSPAKDSIFYDDLSFYKDNSYINLIAARTQDAGRDVFKKVVEAYQTDEVKQVFKDYFEGSYLPAW